MKRGFLIVTFIVSLLLINTAKASKAGVGVINVTPTYKSIILSNGENAVEVKLSISDYNSWKDIYKVEILAESGNKECVHFVFMHYESKDSFNEINLFKEIEGNGYLIPELCDVKRSLVEKTIDDRCLINVTFVFKPIPYCTKLYIIAYDREDEKATLNIQYDFYQDQRNEEIIVPFWSGEPVKISPDLPNAFAGSLSLTFAAFILFKRRGRR